MVKFELDETIIEQFVKPRIRVLTNTRKGI